MEAPALAEGLQRGRTGAHNGGLTTMRILSTMSTAAVVSFQLVPGMLQDSWGVLSRLSQVCGQSSPSGAPNTYMMDCFEIVTCSRASCLSPKKLPHNSQF